MAELPDEGKQGELLLYQTEDGKTRVEVRLEEETVWLNQKTMAELFQKDVRTINEHIKNIYAEGELSPEATIRKFRIVQSEGAREVSRDVDFYNLDVIIYEGESSSHCQQTPPIAKIKAKRMTAEAVNHFLIVFMVPPLSTEP